ncbi:PIN domain-containing protein [Guptibacillus spartinae]|uniref:PIN domain-containing protein n=1 Tax=Guptibacillus spartinae TaxID=3025679 RepID=UPI00235F706B|nr:PIN domain-containing protein [Pseudalkalibacillus spartinae]
MKVFIDSNIFISDFKMNSPGFRVFLNELSVISGEIFIPDVVKDEVVNKHREKVESIIGKARSEMDKLNKFLFKEEKFNGIDSNAVNKEYKDYFERKIIDNGGIFLPYPSTAHEQIVSMELSRRKPFLGEGSGYRDYLIWQTIVEFSKNSNDTIIFITSNIQDFGSNGKVHNHLMEEVTNNECNIILYDGLDNFNDNYIMPQLEKLENTRRELEKGEYEALNISDWVKGEIDYLVSEDDLLFMGVGLTDQIGLASLNTLNQVKIDEVSNVTLFNENELLIDLTVTTDIDFSVSFSWDDFILSHEVRDFIGEEERFEFISSDLNNKFIIELRLIFNLTNKSVDEYELLHLSTQYLYI